MSAESNLIGGVGKRNYSEAEEWLLSSGKLGGGGKAKRLSAFTSLNSFLTEFGSANVELIVENGVNVNADLTIPANVKINPQSDALFNVSREKTLRINAMSDFGERRIFEGPGSKVFGKNAVERISLKYWLGTDASLNATDALNDAISSNFYNDGGVIHIPTGKWQTYGGHSFSFAPLDIVGDGCSPDEAARGSWLELVDNPAGGNNVPKFIIGTNGYFKNVTLRNFGFRKAYSNHATGVRFAGGNADVNLGMFLERCSFYDLNVGVDLKAVGQFQVAQFLSVLCHFVCNIGFQCNSSNTGLNFISPMFLMPHGGIGLKLDQAGVVELSGYEFGGTQGYLAHEAGGTKVNSQMPIGVQINGGHAGITLKGGQDEAVGRTIQNNASIYYPITIKDSLIQGIIDFKASGIVVIKGGKAPAKCFVNVDMPLGFTSYGRAENVTPYPNDYFNNVVNPSTFDGFSQYGILMSESFANSTIKHSQEKIVHKNPLYDDYAADAMHRIGASQSDKILFELVKLNADGTVALAGVNPLKYGFFINSVSNRLCIKTPSGAVVEIATL